MTALLLDTLVVLWWLDDNPTLAPTVKDRLDTDPDIYLSAASVWEVGIEQALGKLTSDGDLAERVRDAGFNPLWMTADHAIAAARLPPHHRDPFDRMLIGQAMCDGLTIMSRDPVFSAYDVPLEKV